MKKKVLLTMALMTAAGSALAASPFTLRADDLNHGHFLPRQVLSADYGFGCEGGNQSPALSWKNPPAGTKSFVLTIHDPDAPTGIGWMHWVIANIPASARSLPAGITADGKNLPAGALQTRTDGGKPGYMGACPPKGQKHRYVITLTALKVAELPGITAESMPALIGFMTGANALGRARVTVIHAR